MKPLLFFISFLFLFSLTSAAENFPVKNIEELNDAVKKAKPGDHIILQNGTWKGVVIKINCSGTKDNPVTIQAQKAGGVIISGKSKLALGGNFIVIDGLYFTDGYAGDDAVIAFKTGKDQIANDCRITNCIINDFNNPRMQENYWIALSGKRNRVDHCSLIHKNNLGVLMAVLLDDDRSRENFHSVDHNYFGERLPLGSNGGEIIRIGVSQHCEFNSNTQITDNFFEHCDGETEVVSVKSCRNIVRNNLFRECQGSVVLRHGNYNTVENNVFLGNDKAGTGGVRIINKGQWVVNNYFYHCRGRGFRSPLSVMNGVPNSPAFRYVAVTDAVVANNSFIECAPMSLCEGSDTERTVVPSHVIFQNNAYYNTKDSKIYDVSDDISKISFINNAVNSNMPQELVPGFIKINAAFADPAAGKTPFRSSFAVANIDSLDALKEGRLSGGFNATAGFKNAGYKAVVKNATKKCGASFYSDKLFTKEPSPVLSVSAKDSYELLQLMNVADGRPVLIELTGTHYIFDKPMATNNRSVILSTSDKLVRLSSSSMDHIFEITGGGNLSFRHFNADLSGIDSKNFITSDINGSSAHSEFDIDQSNFGGFKGNFFTAAKSTMFDSVVVKRSGFHNMEGTVFDFGNETDKKGYYNAEQVHILNNNFEHINGTIINMLRGGNDESTMGPLLVFSVNTVKDCTANAVLISLNGTQRSYITDNEFKNAAPGGIILVYIDAVRADHVQSGNRFINSGSITKNKFVAEDRNMKRSIPAEKN